MTTARLRETPNLGDHVTAGLFPRRRVTPIQEVNPILGKFSYDDGSDECVYRALRKELVR